tara:strand:+ start:18982 stop:20997 length:2016 start_codon:yes stop_codon:yes gene_type:complete
MTTYTIGSGPNDDFADAVLWSAAVGNINDGTPQIGILQEDILQGFLRPNQSFPNGGILKGKDRVTGEAGVGQTLSSTDSNRVILGVSNIDFADLRIGNGTSSRAFQSISSGVKLTRCIFDGGITVGTSQQDIVFKNCVLEGIDINQSSLLDFDKCLFLGRVISRNDTLITINDCASTASDWILGPGTYSGSTAIVRNSYITQNASPSDFSAGSSNNTVGYSVIGDLVSFATGDYRTQDLTTMSTGGIAGDYVGAYPENDTSFASFYPSMYFRGTPNGFTTTPMVLTDDFTWQITANFDGTGGPDRYKFDVFGDWSLSFGDDNQDGIVNLNGGDILTVDGSGDYVIEFDTLNSTYTAVKQASPGITSNINLAILAPVFSAALLATAPQPSVASSFEIQEPSFSIVSSASVPSPIADSSISISAPDFSASSAVTLPRPVSNIDFLLEPPGFSSEISASIQDAEISLEILLKKPLFLSGLGATLPQPETDISIGFGAPSFSVQNTATLLQPEIDAAYSMQAPAFKIVIEPSVLFPEINVLTSIDKPVFNSETLVTLPQPTTSVTMVAGAPVFSASILATIPAKEITINALINAPIFNSEISSTRPVFSLVTNLTLNKPVFSAQSTATLPKPIIDLYAEIKKPIFTASASITGIEIHPSYDAIILLHLKSNIITI